MSMYRYFTPPNLWMDGATAASAFVLLMADFLRPPFPVRGTQADSEPEDGLQACSVERQGSAHET
jgi:hypothetical protein